MDHMVVGVMVGIGRTEMILSDMVGYWIHLINEAVDIGFTLVLVQKGIIVIITIILIGGVVGDIF